jgi:hypothetical protein
LRDTGMRGGRGMNSAWHGRTEETNRFSTEVAYL